MSEEDKVLCSHCLDMRSYTVKSRLKIHHHPQTNDEIIVDDWDAFCDECGHEVYVQDIESRNIDEFVYMCGASDFCKKVIEQNASYDKELGCDMVYMSVEQLKKYLKYFVEEKRNERKI